MKKILIQAIDRFRANEHGVLVATDVAARGLDIPGVRTVIHYQLPHSAEVRASFLFLLITPVSLCFDYHLLEYGPTELCFRFMCTEVGELLELLLMGAALLLSHQMTPQSLLHYASPFLRLSEASDLLYTIHIALSDGESFILPLIFFILSCSGECETVSTRELIYARGQEACISCTSNR